ncbi:pilus assembly protein [Sphingomonas lutea]|uniref:Pilus assembly protein n=1 Tax=Sphingomonas lutea TaxID=1045317 RepID=A0A7G9SKP3_9SPHN|nr:TadE/TadG family type IV pilus assembly protein [Sphingomonas lutea]QNN68418.1 pilus assembly protein [Sphingomonas lutea]
MTVLKHLRRDERGAAIIEMAIAMPTLLLFLYGIFQVGVAFQAKAGMQHALGEGARYATLCYNPTIANGCTVPTNDQIKTRINERVFGTKVGTYSDPVVTNGPANSGYRTLSVTFTMTPNYLFFNGPPVNITETKRVYIAGT